MSTAFPELGEGYCPRTPKGHPRFPAGVSALPPETLSPPLRRERGGTQEVAGRPAVLGTQGSQPSPLRGRVGLWKPVSEVRSPGTGCAAGANSAHPVNVPGLPGQGPQLLCQASAWSCCYPGKVETRDPRPPRAPRAMVPCVAWARLSFSPLKRFTVEHVPGHRDLVGRTDDLIRTDLRSTSQCEVEPRVPAGAEPSLPSAPLLLTPPATSSPRPSGGAGRPPNPRVLTCEPLEDLVPRPFLELTTTCTKPQNTSPDDDPQG